MALRKSKLADLEAQKKVISDIRDLASAIFNGRVLILGYKPRHYQVDWGNDFEFENWMCQQYGDQTNRLDNIIRASQKLIEAHYSRQSTTSQNVINGLYSQVEFTALWTANRIRRGL